MKKLAAVVAVMLCIHAFAETPITRNKNCLLLQTPEGDARCFDGSTRIVNFGFGGSQYYAYNAGADYSYRNSPAFSLSYEQPWSERVGPGYLGVGAYAGFQSEYSRYDNYYYAGVRYYYEHHWNNFMVAARGAYHYDKLITKDAEIYGGALIGLRFQTYSYYSNSPAPNKNDFMYTGQSVWPVCSLFAGARWYFKKNIAAFAELGFGISYANLGVSYKLK